ncbi:HD domain-containing protein [Rhodococcus sp. BP-149]|uniref:HD domain-containing protein n=1 Tax=unclassified Rhodococcus (in: high G+C Gram-positive bacteria) TaxID=192944 RepID=UPI001C9ABFE7|nr:MULTISPECIES: HD domain-containing protein [unclassified Rhodococcus (in: high G+C Gram-positive bacteria)]MBY6687267.1 HD domain-containing protein [Rhodococcus sp. BP-288]MBY6694310.1 HD domain-containing protein [Rhodococcus sp. BP-188]MBY6698019.1 HD domain-containing protein [Rhodococcus sp. BP-285]MBY6704239.1 HD domain-containing protein [Rhodococcus sp. BP-283]MBY6712888.1 HD domain-containing protein [Rhodococcus sp. BP-160]
MTSTSDALTRALNDVPLKEMDPSLLAHAIRYEARGRGLKTSPLEDALAVASYAHLMQRRTTRGDQINDPYITHPSRNVLRLMRYGCADLDALVATALHDTVEDQSDRIVDLLGGSQALGALEAHFGAEVARLVVAVTTPPRTGEDRAAQYVEHVTAVIRDPKVFLVKVSDFVDNAGSLKYLVDEAKRTKLLRKYAPLVTVFEAAATEHGEALGLTADGMADLRDHLASIGEQTEG